MTNSQRNVAIVLIVAFTSTIVGAQTADSGIAAVTAAIDRNTRAQIRTCEATWAGKSKRGSVYPRWDLSGRCWR